MPLPPAPVTWGLGRRCNNKGGEVGNVLLHVDSRARPGAFHGIAFLLSIFLGPREHFSIAAYGQICYFSVNHSTLLYTLYFYISFQSMFRHIFYFLSFYASNPVTDLSAYILLCSADDVRNRTVYVHCLTQQIYLS